MFHIHKKLIGRYLYYALGTGILFAFLKHEFDF